MPPKTVSCAVCNQTVLKAQTLARKDGSRACRNHPGIEDEAQALQKEEKAIKIQEIKSNSRQGFRPAYLETRLLEAERDAAKFREDVYSHCWTCGCEGIGLREYFAESLVAIHRLQLRGEFNFLSLPKDAATLMGNPNVLAVLPYDDGKDQKIRRDITDRRVKDIIHLLRFVNMCVKCIDRHGVRDRLEALFPTPTPQQFEAMMSVVVALEPTLDALAEMKEKQN